MILRCPGVSGSAASGPGSVLALIRTQPNM
jgi:hypothetical protein